jgi:hypothetical protein
VAANIDSIEFGHLPVKKRNPGRFMLLEHIPGLLAVFRFNNLVAPLMDVLDQKLSPYRIVVSNEHFHLQIPSAIKGFTFMDKSNHSATA